MYRLRSSAGAPTSSSTDRMFVCSRRIRNPSQCLGSLDRGPMCGRRREGLVAAVRGLVTALVAAIEGGELEAARVLVASLTDVVHRSPLKRSR